MKSKEYRIIRRAWISADRKRDEEEERANCGAIRTPNEDEQE